MQTTLSPEFSNTHDGDRAEAILRKCVHCGFCTATCPTYQLLGDELDGPRGRIYLIKQALEGEAITRKTQLHLDRCLTCRACETTCPSGVEFGELLEIGRRVVDEKVPRPPLERAARAVLREGLTSPAFGAAMKVAQAVRPVLPATLKAKVAARSLAKPTAWKSQPYDRKMLMLEGCVQPGIAPGINPATRRVLDAAGIETLVADNAGCCGAIRLHLSDPAGALAHAKRNIDAWWPLLENPGVEAIIVNASGCGTTVKDYGRLLEHDPAYRDKAREVAKIARDVSELLPAITDTLCAKLASQKPKLVFQSPCSLQHGQQLRSGVETGLRALGYAIRPATHEAHLRCGSAGTYSVLQPKLAGQLRDRKLANLAAQPDEIIVSANVGCIQHLQSGTSTPVRHWLEVLDDGLQ